LIACSTVLVACGHQPTPTTAATFGVATTTPPTSGLQDYQQHRSGGWQGPNGGGQRHDGNWDRRGGQGGGWDGGWGGGYGCADCGGGWGGGYGGYGGWDGGYGGWGGGWGWPYYLPPIYTSASFGNPFAPPPLAAGPWISPFYGYLGYVGI
jgi:hypothetical protein